LAQNWLERGGHVFEPKCGLESRALSKSKPTTKINDTTESILVRPALITGNVTNELLIFSQLV